MRKHDTYYRCGINAKTHAHQPWYPTPPPNVLVREDLLIEPLARFFTERIFGPNRTLLLAGSLPTGQAASEQQDTRRAALHADILELRRRRDNLVQELQTYKPIGDEEIDVAWRDSIRQQFAANVTEERAKTRQLAEIIRQQQDGAASPNCLKIISGSCTTPSTSRSAITH